MLGTIESAPGSAQRLNQLAGAANAAHQKAGESIVAAILHGLEAGRALVEAQGLVPYGQWGQWLSANFKGADRSARRWMRLYRERDRLPGGDPLRTGVSELTPSAALALLATRDEAEPERPPMSPEDVAAFHRCEAVIRSSMIAGAAAWRKLAERIAARPEGLQTLIRVVAAARIGPPLPVKPADLQLALDTWNEHDLVHRLLRANDSQPRLCGRTLLAIESRGLHRPRFGTFEAWRAETGWSGPEMDEGLAWARAHPDVRAELPYSEADCCKQAWTMLSLELDEPRDEQERDGDRPTDGEKRAFNTSLNACMKVAAAAGWPWPKGIGLFVRAAEELGPA